jgi:hypothetical protein
VVRRPLLAVGRFLPFFVAVFCCRFLLLFFVAAFLSLFCYNGRLPLTRIGDVNGSLM